MKLKLILAATLFTAIAYAQDAQPLNVEEAVKPMSKGSNPSFTVLIPQNTLKSTDKDWRKYISAGSKGKVVDANGEIFIAGAVNKNVAATPFNVYSTLIETTDGVKLTAWLSLSDSAYISKDMGNDKDLAAQKYIHDFAVQQYQEGVSLELDGERDKSKKLDNEMKDLIKAQEKSTKRINEDTRSIERAKSDIIANDAEQKRKADEIFNQKGVLEAAKTSGNDQAIKDNDKLLKTMEGDKKKLEKQSEKLNKNIDDWSKEIREEQRKIDTSVQDQKAKSDQIDKQRQATQLVEDKLKNIK